MLRKPYFLVASICLLCLFVMSPLATGFWALYTARIDSVYDIHDGKLKRSASKTTLTIVPTAGNGHFIIHDYVAMNYFDENGTYIKTVYRQGRIDFYRFVGGELQHIVTDEGTWSEDTLRSFDSLYTDPEAIVRNY